MQDTTSVLRREPAPPQPDLDEITAALGWFFDPGDVAELRVLYKNSRGYSETISGYYNDMAALATSAARHSSDGKNVYFTLNPVKPELLARRVNRDEVRPAACTQDADILKRNWLPIDVDAVRASGISSTDEEHQAALEKAEEIAQTMQQRYGWPPPVRADSGNGGHLLWYFPAPNDDETTALIRRVLERLAGDFDGDRAKVDKVVFNAGRIWKVPGAVARKGDHTPDRPHRLSCVLDVPEELQPVTREQLESYAPLATPTATPRPTSSGARGGRTAFDVAAWIEEHQIEVRGHEPYTNKNGAVHRYRLVKCPLCGESNGSAVILQMSDGSPAYKCHHNRCSGKGWKDFRAAVEPDYAARRSGDLTSKEKSDSADNSLPKVCLPGGAQSISSTARTLGGLLAERQTHFVRGGAVVNVVHEKASDLNLQPVKPAKLASDAEKVAKLVRVSGTKKGQADEPVVCSKATADLILNAQDFLDVLPELTVLSRCPVLVEHGADLVEVAGYDVQSGVWAAGSPSEVVSLSDARELLHGLVANFRFATEGDRSRALAALITPALIQGGLLKGRAALDLGEADQSQAGKGYRNRLTAAINRDVPATVSQQQGGVGSMEETFNSELVAGRTFISLDNVRGRVNSQKIEMFLTEETYLARCPFTPSMRIDPKRVCAMFTSNNAEMTIDLANRASCVRILKQSDGYQFPSYPEGGLLEHVRANQPRYLGAVFAVVRAWHAEGMPCTAETRHDFRVWAQTLDWIVQNLLGAGPLMDGHRETQQRMATPWLNWLRSVVLAIAHQNRSGEWLIAADLLEIIERAGDIEVPGLRDDGDLGDEDVRTNALLGIGRRLRGCFGDQEQLTLDSFTIHRDDWTDGASHRRRQYRIVQVGPVCTTPAPAPQCDDGASHPAAAQPATLLDDGPEEPEGYYDDYYEGPDGPEEPDGYYDNYYEGPDGPEEPDGYYDDYYEGPDGPEEPDGYYDDYYDGTDGPEEPEGYYDPPEPLYDDLFTPFFDDSYFDPSEPDDDSIYPETVEWLEGGPYRIPKGRFVD